MRKNNLFYGTLLFLFVFPFAFKNTQASLVTIDIKGKVVLNVLSSEDSIELEIPKRDYLAIKNIVALTPDPDSRISLTKVDGEIKLNISSKFGEKSLNVTNYKEGIIEVEERPEIERITIGILNDKFTIKQRGVIALTDYEINIDPQTASLTLSTPSGLKYLSILPRQAIEVILRSRIINRIGNGNNIELNEDAGEGLAYTISGERVINLFNLFEYQVPVTTKVSASTGEILFIDQPTWLKIFGFLFV